MNRNAILDNLDDIPVSANVAVPFSSTVSAPISTPSLIETNINNESFLQQLLSNKIYIYIIIGIIILAIASYYLYIKYFYKSEKEAEKEAEEKEAETEPEEKEEPEKKEPEIRKHIISSDIEYYLLDSSKNPILINKYLNKQAVLIKRPKLTHPNEKNISDTENNEDNEDNDDNEEYEDNNITTQDLTREEIEELKNQLEIMQKKQNSSITAENEDDNEGSF